MRIVRRVGLGLLLAIAIASAAFADFSGKVVGVSDGDTITVRTNDGRTVKVRLNGIDCPESHQAFGSRSKEFTSHYAFGQEVTIKEHGGDKYGRTIGDVILRDGRSLNTELVRSGLAWHYVQYSKDPELARLEKGARAAKVGLWSDPKAVAPWDYRHEGKNAAPKDDKEKAQKTAAAKPKATITNETLRSSSSTSTLAGGFGAPASEAAGSTSGTPPGKTRNVSTYTRKDGTVVKSYSRSAPSSSRSSGSSSGSHSAAGKH
jgi:endonuclease YncB( thermonuclease family)